jgi:hypothetical protein
LFVCGYKDDGTQIPGVYKIPANGTITVAAGTMVVPNKRTFSLWGGVYLEGAGIRNTSWETDGLNNCWTLICKSQCPITIVSIAQTQVIGKKLMLSPASVYITDAARITQVLMT